MRELDSPHALLQNPVSLLSKMVQRTGSRASRKLHEMAEEAHRSRNREFQIRIENSLPRPTDAAFLPPSPLSLQSRRANAPFNLAPLHMITIEDEEEEKSLVTNV